MDAGLFDMLQNAADDDLLTVGERVNVDLVGVFEELVDQDRDLLAAGGHLGVHVDGIGHVMAKTLLIIHDRHRPPAQHV